MHTTTNANLIFDDHRIISSILRQSLGCPNASHTCTPRGVRSKIQNVTDETTHISHPYIHSASGPHSSSFANPTRAKESAPAHLKDERKLSTRVERRSIHITFWRLVYQTPDTAGISMISIVRITLCMFNIGVLISW
jgi:hypothetical protein